MASVVSCIKSESRHSCHASIKSIIKRSLGSPHSRTIKAQQNGCKYPEKIIITLGNPVTYKYGVPSAQTILQCHISLATRKSWAMTDFMGELKKRMIYQDLKTMLHFTPVVLDKHLDQMNWSWFGRQVLTVIHKMNPVHTSSLLLFSMGMQLQSSKCTYWIQSLYFNIIIHIIHRMTTSWQNALVEVES